jgi:hypothetical protein
MPVSYTSPVTRIGLLVVLALSVFAAALSFRTRVAGGGTPGWDSASHGVQGYALAQDVARLDAGNVVADVFGHRYHYPPGHPIALAAAFLVFGPSWWTAIGVSALLFAALAVVLYATAESKVAGWISALLALTCPALLALSGMIMLEIPAAILMTLSLRLYARSLEDDSAVRPLGWTLTVFMVTAAQYAACAIVTLLAFEMWRSRAWVRGMLLRFVRSRALFHPLHILIALAVIMAVAIRLTGGWKIGSLSMTRAGGPMIAAALLAGVRVAWLVWKRRPEVPRRYRDIFFAGIVPIYFWVFVIYPPRFQQFAEWISRPPEVHERTDPAHWTFYPQYFMGAGHVALWVSLGVILLVTASFFRRAIPERVRFLQWAVVIGALLVLGHHARQTRFIVPFLMAWWILASETLVGLLPTMRARLVGSALVTLAILFPGVELYRSGLRVAVSPPAGHLTYATLLECAVRNIGDARSIRVIGGIDGLSRHLFEWELRKKFDLRRVSLRFNLDLPDDLADAEGPRKLFDRWMAGNPEEVVVTVEPADLETRPSRPVREISKSDHDWPEFTMRFLSTAPQYRLIRGFSATPPGTGVCVYRRRN